MDWFKRYGITGSYFLILILAWLFVLYPCKMQNIDTKNLFGFIAIAFLPIGYIITILQQSIYLSFKCLGLHRKAKNNAMFEFPGKPDCEPIIEVYSTFSIIHEWIELKYQKHFQDWIRRRMDVLVISSSILTATLISPLCVIALRYLVFREKEQFLNLNYHYILIVVMILISAIMFWNIILLRIQLTKLLTKIYKKYREKNKYNGYFFC